MTNGATVAKLINPCSPAGRGNLTSCQICRRLRIERVKGRKYLLDRRSFIWTSRPNTASSRIGTIIRCTAKQASSTGRRRSRIQIPKCQTTRRPAKWATATARHTNSTKHTRTCRMSNTGDSRTKANKSSSTVGPSRAGVWKSWPVWRGPTGARGIIVSSRLLRHFCFVAGRHGGRRW